jgi:hypothetical protein
MSINAIDTDLRQLVLDRAEGLCEYCLIAELDTILGCQVDHIISEKHGDSTIAENLAYACVYCNRAKGSDIGSLHWESGEFVRFFNPRADRWAEHFKLVESQITPLTKIGEVTARILQFNSPERILERRQLHAIGRYPGAAARGRMRA